MSQTHKSKISALPHFQRRLLSRFLLAATFALITPVTAHETGVVDIGRGCAKLNFLQKNSSNSFESALSKASRNNWVRSAENPSYSANNTGYLYTSIQQILGLFEALIREKNIIGFQEGKPNPKPIAAYSGTKFKPLPSCTGGYNASWVTGKSAGLLFVTKDGALQDDVVAHEIAHGLINRGANLEYRFQPGALNESISDVLGITYNIWKKNGNRFPESSTLSESDFDLGIGGPDNAKRNLLRPTKYISPLGRAYPDNYSKFEKLPYSVDYGGVHINSSIINRAFSLMVMGRNDSPPVTSIGVKNAASIFALSARHNLSPTEQFQDARVKLANTAKDHFSLKEWKSVHQAFDAVGIPDISNWKAEYEKLKKTVPNDPALDDPIASNPEAETLPSRSNWPAILVGAMGLVMIGWSIVSMRPARYPGINPQPVPAPSPEPNPGHYPGGYSDNVEPEPFPSHLEDNPDQIEGYGTIYCDSERFSYDLDLLSSREGLILGRDPNYAHIAIKKRQLSARHARVRLYANVIKIEDLNSTNGVYINNRKLAPFSPLTISARDKVKLGTEIIKFE